MTTIGHKRWTIALGYIPGWSQDHESRMMSPESASILNPGGHDARVEVTILFQGREPVGPYQFVIPAQRMRHIRFDELNDPEPIPRDIDFTSVIESDVPIIVQHSRRDSRPTEMALISTMACPSPET